MTLNDFHDLGYQHMFNHGFQDSNDLMDDLGYPDDKTETSTYCTLQTRHSSANKKGELGDLGIQTQLGSSEGNSNFSLKPGIFWVLTTKSWKTWLCERFSEDLGRPGR